MSDKPVRHQPVHGAQARLNRDGSLTLLDARTGEPFYELEPGHDEGGIKIDIYRYHNDIRFDDTIMTLRPNMVYGLIKWLPALLNTARRNRKQQT